MELNNKERPLAYIKAQGLPTEALSEISGGSTKFTTQKVGRRTNAPPGYDETEDVVFD